MKTYKEELIENMTFRIERIDFLAERLSKITSAINYSDLYLEISHFVHFIQKEETLRRFYNDLLTFNSKLKEELSYQKAINRLNILIQQIAYNILNRDDFDDFVVKNNYGFRNPIPNSEMTSKPDILLKNLYCYNVNKNGFVKDDFETIRSIYLTILEKFECQDGFDKVIEMLEEYSTLLRTISFFEEYEIAYKGSNSAFNLLIIYKALMPLANVGPATFEKMQASAIIKGEKFLTNNLETLQNDCHKIFNYLKNNLLSNLSIEYTIDRFITFLSLYFDEPIDISKPEKSLQRKFEEFVFSNGYYPISEAQLSNGRIDTLILNETNSFLFEFKQFNLGKTEEDEAGLENKLKGAKVQSSIYHDRLRTFPFLNNTIFILVFSDRQIKLVDNIDRIMSNDLRFVFKFINISRLSPSTQPDELKIGIKELIE